MKLSQTKNVMFYSTPTMISRIYQLWDDHVKKYKQQPKRIYMTRVEWTKYEKEICKSPVIYHEYKLRGYPRITKNSSIPRRWGIKPTTMSVSCLTFKGVPVVIDEDWYQIV